MEVLLLDLLFFPKSIALIGASPKEGALGRAIMENIIKGGYTGVIFPVNPRYQETLGFSCYSNVRDLPIPADLAVICAPAKVVPEIIEDLGTKGTRVAVVISAGFSEVEHEEGTRLQEKMLEAARQHGVRIVGPNCLGIINTGANLNSTFFPLAPKKGNVAFVAQSGAMLVSVLEWARVMGIGFSKMVSVGGLSDLNFADYLEYLQDDPQTESIVLYVEAITDAQRFLEVAKKTVMIKPVLVMKSGRFQGTTQAVRSHSGALAGSDDVYDAAFRQAGLSRLYELQDLYDMLLTLNHLIKLKGNHLSILTNGGGVGILAADALIASGGELTTLSASTLKKLDTVLPPTWSHGNPVDIIGDALPKRYEKTLNILMDDPSLHNILLMHCPTSLSPSKEVLEVILETIKKRKTIKPSIFMVSLQQSIRKKTLRQFSQHKIPIFPTPERAVRTFMHLLECESEKKFIDNSPKKPIKVVEKVTHLLKTLTASAKQEWLDHYVTQEILTSYEIPVVRSAFASTPSEVKKVSQKMDFPLVLKIASKDIVHKSDVGGVVLNLTSPEEVEKKAQDMLKMISSQNPQAQLEGFILQPMIPLDHGFELFLGGLRDDIFGPVVIFGSGGKSVEVVNDKALALAPLTKKSARMLIERTEVSRQLKGYRGQAPVPLEQLTSCLIKLSYLLANHPEIVELDINPLLVDTKKILVLDTRMRVGIR